MSTSEDARPIQSRSPDWKELLPVHARNDVRVVNAGLYESTTPLIHAVMKNHLDSAKALLRRAADANQAVNGITPLHVAVFDRNEDMMRLLLEHGANPSHYDAVHYPTCEAPFLDVIRRQSLWAVQLLASIGRQLVDADHTTSVRM